MVMQHTSVQPQKSLALLLPLILFATLVIPSVQIQQQIPQVPIFSDALSQAYVYVGEGSPSPIGTDDPSSCSKPFVDMIAFMPTTSVDTCKQICQLEEDCKHYRYTSDGLCLLSENMFDFPGNPGDQTGFVSLTSQPSIISDLLSATSIAQAQSLNSIASSSAFAGAGSSADCGQGSSVQANAYSQASSSGGAASSFASASASSSSSGCNDGMQQLNAAEYGKEYLGEDIADTLKVRSPIDCQKLCDLVTGCEYYTYMDVDSSTKLCWLMSIAYNVGSESEKLYAEEDFADYFVEESSISGKSTVSNATRMVYVQITDALLDRLTYQQPTYYNYTIKQQSPNTSGCDPSAPGASAQASEMASNQCYELNVNCHHGYKNRFVKHSTQYKCNKKYLCKILGYRRPWPCKRNCL